MSDTDTPKILEIINTEVATKSAQRSDEVGQFVDAVLSAGDPDGRFEYLARAYIENQGQDTRRACVTMSCCRFWSRAAHDEATTAGERYRRGERLERDFGASQTLRKAVH